jgi:squalene-hopene/tetraprenyl-beta-curcumene cyclase
MRLFLAALLLTGVLVPAAAAQEPKVTPNRPDEPLAEKLSLRQSAAMLDEVASAWTRQKNCGSCHTNYAFLVARPDLKKYDSEAEIQIRKFFEDRVAHWDDPKGKPRWDTEVVATAATLAIHDARTTGKLHARTKLALDRMWTLQRKDGAWDWLKCGWPPLEHDDYYGALMAAVGVGMAPEGYADSLAARDGVARLRKYFADTRAPDLHHRAMLLWAGRHLKGWTTEKDRDQTVKDLLQAQQKDGGWSLASLGDYTRADGTPNAKNAGSDGYGTGFVIFMLRQADVPADHAKIKEGLAWLKANQRQSGRWFTRSLHSDGYHFITHAGTAYAVMALRACSED